MLGVATSGNIASGMSRARSMTNYRADAHFRAFGGTAEESR